MQISEISDWPPKGIWTALARKPPPGPFPGAANSHMPHLYGDREDLQEKEENDDHDTSWYIINDTILLLPQQTHEIWSGT